MSLIVYIKRICRDSIESRRLKELDAQLELVSRKAVPGAPCNLYVGKVLGEDPGVFMTYELFVKSRKVWLRASKNTGSIWPPKLKVQVQVERLDDSSVWVDIHPDVWEGGDVSSTDVAVPLLGGTSGRYVTTAPLTGTLIPTCFIWTANGRTVPSGVFRDIEEFSRKNPTFDSTVYSGLEFLRLLRGKCPLAWKRAYETIPTETGRQTFFWLCALAVNGGVRIDRALSARNIDAARLLMGVDLLVVRDSPSKDLAKLGSSMVACRGGLVFLMKFVDVMALRILEQEEGSPWDISAGNALGNALNLYAEKEAGAIYTPGLHAYADLRVRVVDNTGVSLVSEESIVASGPILANTSVQSWGRVPYLCALRPPGLDERSPEMGKVIFQTWESHCGSSRMQRAVRSWTSGLDSSPGWTHVLFDKLERYEDVGDPWKPAYSRLEDPSSQVRLWSLLRLYSSGGVYADIDTVSPKFSIHQLILKHFRNCDLLLVHSSGDSHVPVIMVARPRQQLIMRAIRECIANPQQDSDIWNSVMKGASAIELSRVRNIPHRKILRYKGEL